MTKKDGTLIYYKDWGSGQPVVFSHGWPLRSDRGEVQMLFLADHGYRCMAHDRRGQVRSSRLWSGNEMDTYADYLSEIIETLDLQDTVPPLMLKTAANPGGLSIEVFDGIRLGSITDRS